MAARIPKPNEAVLRARARRDARKAHNQIKEQWFIDKLVSRIKLTMKQRVTLATAFLKDKVIRNISRPVTKGTGPRGGRVVFNRSKDGEFPKADTTHLMKTIFSDVKQKNGSWEGYVGTPLDYGLILETKMNRSFLLRTLNKERRKIKKILSGPLKGGGGSSGTSRGSGGGVGGSSGGGPARDPNTGRFIKR